MSFNSGGVTLTGQFDLKSKQPIDGRYVIVSKAELIALLTTALYPGLEFTLTLSAETTGTTQVTLTASDSATYAGDYKVGTYKVKPDGVNIMRIYDENNNTLDPDGQTVVAKVSNKVTVYEVSENKTVDTIADGVNEGDVAIIKTQISEEHTANHGSVSAEHPQRISYTCYIWTGSAWAAADGNYSAANVFLSQDMIITKTFGKHTVTSGNKTPYHRGDSLEFILMDAFSESNVGTISSPSQSFIVTSNGSASRQVGSSFSAPEATFTVTSYGSYTYGPSDTGVEFTDIVLTGGDNTVEQSSIKKDSASQSVKIVHSAGGGVHTDASITRSFSASYKYTAGVNATDNLGKTSSSKIAAKDNGTDSCSATYSSWRYMYYGSATGYEAANIVSASSKQYSSGSHEFTVSKGAKYAVFAVPANNNTGTTSTSPTIKYFENGSYVSYPGTFTSTTATIGPNHTTTGDYTTTYNVWYHAAPNQSTGFAGDLKFQISIY